MNQIKINKRYFHKPKKNHHCFMFGNGYFASRSKLAFISDFRPISDFASMLSIT